MDGLFRRGGVWYARLVIPRHLRSVLLKTEFVASTGVREPAIARVVAAELLAGWRRRLLDLSRMAAGFMDVEQISAGHPALSGGGYLALQEAAKVSGIDELYLLTQAAEGGLSLYYRCGGLAGHLCGSEEFEDEIGPEGITLIVPLPEQMSELAIWTNYAGVLRLRGARETAMRFTAGGSQDFVLFDLPNNPDQFFAPEKPLLLKAADLCLATVEVELVRKTWALTITPAQLDIAKAAKLELRPPVNAKSQKRLSEAVVAYMKIRELSCSPDQARRVRGALDLLVELESNPRLCEIDRDRLEDFRDKRLVTVPAHENKIRLLHGTKTITQSIKAVNGTEWERISLSEQVKRLNWISAMFVWLKSRDWIDRDPSSALVEESTAVSNLRKSQGRKQDSRSIFTREDLTTIFTAGEWFATGRGILTAAGTFREFSTYYYWLPLMALLTGGRINELSQIFLKDIRQTEDGTWFVAIASLDDDGNLKKQKNANAERLVPIHPLLISLGLISWRNVLDLAGYTRLFPELKFDQTKGFGKAPSKWFSSYLKGLGWERDGRKVFHSFRATLATECVNRLHLTAMQTAQISGHSRGDGSLVKHYIKDEIPGMLIESVARLDFDLPAIAAFDCDAGLQAVRSALARKNKGLGGIEDC